MMKRMTAAPPTNTIQRRPWRALWLLALGCLFAAAAALAAEPSNVLVLYSNGRLVPGNVEVERGLRSTIVSSAERPVRIFSEFLDRPEFDGPAYEATFTTYLRNKYADRPPAVLVAVAKESLEFLLRHRAQLFPGVPLVHAAVFKTYPKPFPALPADVVGVPVEYDPAATIEQALRWHPRARHLLVVTGSMPRDREWEALLRDVTARFADRVKIEFLAGQPTDAVFKRLRGLDADTVVFTPGFYQSGDGLPFTPRDSVAAMAKAATAPIYGTFSTFIGTGAVGGVVPSFEAMGRQAGLIVGKLLDGAPPASLALPKVMPNELNVDLRQTRRWGIADADVPAGAVVQFREPTFWEAYRDATLVAAAVILLQAGLIATLLLERRRRRAAELAVQKQRSELAHASRLAVAGELTASIAHEINQPLAAILTNADAAEMLLDSGADRRDDLRRIVADIRRDDLRASDVIRRLRSLLAKQAIERQPFELNETLGDVCAMLQAEARRRQVTLEVQTAATAGNLVGDPIQIQQVVINLVINAMDAVADVPEALRSVVVAVVPVAEGVAFEVRDRGHGIAAEHLPKLFDSFFSTKRRGMGLGLSIARTIVEAHGGRIRAASAPGAGTVFTVELPESGGRSVPPVLAT